MFLRKASYRIEIAGPIYLPSLYRASWLQCCCIPAFVLRCICYQWHSYIFLKRAPYFSFFKPGNPVYLLSFSLVVIFSYLHHYWLAPGLFVQKRFAVYFFSVAFFITTIIVLQYLAASTLLPAATGTNLFAGKSVILSGAVYTFILLLVTTLSSVIIRLNEQLNESGQSLKKIKGSLLKTQINPHFLFNSLNWIYFLAVEESDQTPEAIIQLSGLMRHVLKAPDADVIDLRKELGYIKNYLSLQTGRLGDTVSINYSLPFYNGDGKIAPLLLMSFIENAFKHGVNPDEDAAIDIEISVVNDKLTLQVINNIVSPVSAETSEGVGIANAKQRLNILYPSRHRLEILEDNKIYSVKLSIAIL